MRNSVTLMTALLAALATGTPALACSTYAPVNLHRVKFASTVVIAHLRNEHGAFDATLPQEPPSERDPGSFDIQVDKVLKGKAGKTLTARWLSNNDSSPNVMTDGPFVVALINNRSAAFPRNAHLTPGTLIVLQDPCSDPFVFPAGSTQADDIRHILIGKPLAHHQQVLKPIWAVAPKKALEDEVGGRVSIDCLAKKSGSVHACKVTNEWPKNYGFGEATKAWVQQGTRLEQGTFFAGDIIRMTYKWSPD